MKKLKIAILGSTSHIARGLINNFFKEGGFNLYLYTRSPDKVCSFLSAIEKSPNKDCIIRKGYKDFTKSSYNLIINCVGVGTLNKLQGNYTNYFMINEEYDNLVIKYLQNNCPNALYISFSSGAVYGREFSIPAEENTMNCIRVNHVSPEDYYSITRLNSEAKHRAFSYLNIVDLRIFSYFSRFIDLKDTYFITEVINCVLNKKVLETSNVNFVRDYLHPKDLYTAIRKCMDAGKINSAFDITSSKPAEKKEILDYFSLKYGLEYKISKSLHPVSATGMKNIYYSNYNNTASIGYKPAFSSMDTIKEESKYILNRLTDKAL